MLGWRGALRGPDIPAEACGWGGRILAAELRGTAAGLGLGLRSPAGEGCEEKREEGGGSEAHREPEE